VSPKDEVQDFVMLYSRGVARDFGLTPVITEGRRITEGVRDRSPSALGCGGSSPVIARDAPTIRSSGSAVVAWLLHPYSAASLLTAMKVLSAMSKANFKSRSAVEIRS
jgi:hypothetical protein